MSDESSRKEKGDRSSSSSIPSLQASGGSQPRSSLVPSKSTGSSSGNSLMHNSLARPDSPSSVSEQAHLEPASTSSSKRQSPIFLSSPPSDSLLHPPRLQMRPHIRYTSSRPPSCPWLPNLPAQITSHPHAPSSQMSHSSCLDSKYPSALHMPNLGLIQFDALADDDEEMGDDLEDKGVRIGSFHVSWRGVSNMLSLLGLVSAFVMLFVIYPILLYYRYGPINSAIAANIHINSTGQAQEDTAMTSLTRRDQHQLSLMTDDASIDPATPPGAFMKWGKNGAKYNLAFSDERVTQGRAATRCVNDGFIEVGFVKDKERRLAYWTGEWTIIGAEEELPSSIDRFLPKNESLLVTLHMDGRSSTSSSKNGSILSPDPDRSRDAQMSIDYVRIYELRTLHGYVSCDDRVPISLYLNF